jgi:hypothetical protein
MSRVLNPDEVTRLQELQEYFAVAATAKRLDDFAKWVFSAVTLVATLGTGFAMFSNQSLRPEAKVMFGIAMVLVGLSLGCAVMMLAPAFPQIKLGSPSDLNDKFSTALKGRRKWTFAAAIFLSLAFLVAGLSPALSAITSQPQSTAGHAVNLTYSLVGKKVTIVLQLQALQAGSPVSLKVSKMTKDPKFGDQLSVVYQNGFAAEPDGKAVANVSLEDSTVSPLKIEYSAIKADGRSMNATETLQLAAP